MKVDGVAYRSVWVDPDDGWSVRIFDQTKLPWSLEIPRLTSRDQVAHAIRSMQVRGAPLIGAVAAYGLCLALREDASTEAMERDTALLAKTRPTAINLRWALDRMLTRLRNTAPHTGPSGGSPPPMPRRAPSRMRMPPSVRRSAARGCR